MRVFFLHRAPGAILDQNECVFLQKTNGRLGLVQPLHGTQGPETRAGHLRLAVRVSWLVGTTLYLWSRGEAH